MIRYPRVVKDKVYKDMFRVLWGKDADGIRGKEDLSDMVNYTRAVDAIKCYEENKRKIEARRAAIAPTEAAGALF
jgi:hypothetical protein